MEVNPAELGLLRSFLARHRGWDLGEDKAYLVRDRLGPVAACFGFTDVPALIRAVTSGRRDLVEPICEALTISETMFFRDPPVFAYVRDRILPALRTARAPSRTLRIWSAACATGQEPYSIAIMLADHFEDLAGWDVEILCTDANTESLRRAEQALYSHFEVQRGLSAVQMVKHFRQEGTSWRIDAALKRGVTFRRSNLVEPWTMPEGPFDVILLRYALIYFKHEHRPELFAQLRKRIRPDGYLILGGSESIPQCEPSFRPASDGGRYYVPCHARQEERR